MEAGDAICLPRPAICAACSRVERPLLSRTSATDLQQLHLPHVIWQYPVDRAILPSICKNTNQSGIGGRAIIGEMVLSAHMICLL